MMKLYLVRHGEAKESLTERGRRETEAVARFLQGIELDEILHSEKVRAKETAAILGHIIAPEVTLIERAGLAPMDPIDTLVSEIETFDRNVMLVGHLPFLERLLTTLLYQEEQSPPLTFCGSSVVCLEGEGKSWTIAWVVTPELASGRPGKITG